MKEKDLQNFMNKLLKEKRRLEGELKAFALDLAENQAAWSGEHSYENHLADLGTDTAMRETDVSFEYNVRDLLNRVNDALARIDDGTYGLCKVCGKPIPVERLRAIPWADLCIEDKRKEEMGP
ncbi:MAG: TraR/DksA C4-type zinc finger protein [Actinobacteria bacterium]|nr:TraR/DksA C4-type zinc finger protein [Actinomycetota bacterium]